MGEDKVELFYINGEISHALIPLSASINQKFKGIDGPSNIVWKKEVNFSSPLEYISPKSLKKITKALESSMDEFTISLNEYLSEKDYADWFKLYKDDISSRELGIVRLSETWFDQEKDKSIIGSIIIRYSSGELAGGAIIIKEKTGTIQCAYRTHKHMHIKDSSIAAILEYKIDEYALKFGFKAITRGTDTNLYGVRLSIGLHDFKLNYGFVPNALDKGKSSYYPRKLVFFQEYAEILTYQYTHNGSIEMLKTSTGSYINKTDLL